MNDLHFRKLPSMNKPITKMSGIPMPETARAGSRRGMYPFEDLEVGESFFVPEKGLGNLRQLCRDRKRKSGRNFFADNFQMKNDDGSETDGVMVWRLPDDETAEQGEE